MDLYIQPMSCSLVPHIALLEAGIPFRLQRVDRRSKLLPDGRDYLAIAPQGIVPALELPDGGLLTECAAVLQYIADRVPDKGLAPTWGTPERYRLAEWLNFVTTELHKKHNWFLFSTKVPEDIKPWARASVTAPLNYVAAHLEGRSYLLGDRFTVADAYLFWNLFTLPHAGVPLDTWPSLSAFFSRIRERPSVAAALKIEGPLYAAEVAANAANAAAPPPPAQASA